MKSMKNAAALVCLAALGSVGCMANQQGHLYDMKTGKASVLVVDGFPSASGSVHGTLPDGSSCKGTFSALSPENAQAIAKSDVLFTENADASVALVNCGASTLLRCTMAGRPGAGFSYGVCTDQGGTQYSMIF